MNVLLGVSITVFFLIGDLVFTCALQMCILGRWWNVMCVHQMRGDNFGGKFEKDHPCSSFLLKNKRRRYSIDR
jgi:hypothetical protein